MSRTDIPPAILAWSLRRMAGDGSVEWVCEPIRASELLDVADLLDENAKLRELAERAWKSAERLCQAFDGPCRDDGVTIYEPCPMGEHDEECVYGQLQRELRELGIEVE